MKKIAKLLLFSAMNGETPILCNYKVRNDLVLAILTFMVAKCTTYVGSDSGEFAASRGFRR